MIEIWKNVAGFDSYQVSNAGRVRSLKYGRVHVLSAGVNNVTGYFTVNLSKGGVIYPRYVHRLVAEAFIENPEGKPQVNHVNGDKADNRAENLEWCTAFENLRHARATGLLVNSGRRYPITDRQFLSIVDNPDLSVARLAKKLHLPPFAVRTVRKRDRERSADTSVIRLF